MTDVVSVRFKDRGKPYFFDPGGLEVPDGASVVVETAKGLELGRCIYGNHPVEDDKLVPPLRQVVRLATEDDLRVVELNKAREKEAFAICKQKIADHGLDMKLVRVECNFEGNKILFFFTSDGRVDFRELVKDLASVFRTRIELRQIGVRDEAKMIGGLGICGRPFCCSQFLDEFHPVSTKMAKTQAMSLNPSKISGCCGRFMCCLRYEQAAYEDLVKKVPKNGAFVETVAGYGNVTQVNLLRQQVKVRLDGAGDATVRTFDADEVAAVPGGRPKEGEPLPKVLTVKPKPAPAAEPQEDPWARPILFADDDGTRSHIPAEAEETPRKKNRRRSRGRGKGSGQGNSQGTAPAKNAGKGKSQPARAGGSKAQGKSGAKPAAQGEENKPRKSGGNRRRYNRRPRSGGGERSSEKE